jgi:hypothetical protein
MTSVIIVGWILAIVGLAIEGLGAVAAGHYAIRRRLVCSPFTLAGLGFGVFFVGAAIVAAASLLGRGGS